MDSSTEVSENDVFALNDTVNELEKTQKALDALQTKYNALAVDLSHIKYNSIDTVWRYFPRHCDEFQYLPKVDLLLREDNNYHNVGGYSFGQIIGEGQFSTVYKCKEFISNQSCPSSIAEGGGLAVKVLHKDLLLTIDGALRTERELKALHVLGAATTHPNLVRFKACLHGRRGVYIITEEMPLDLFEFMRCFRGHLDINVASVITKAILDGLRHVHYHNISHGDIKPENILVDVRRSNQIAVKLCDFGLCCHLTKHSSLVCRDFSGTSGFYAPETLIAPDYCAYRADIFSLGCVAMELLLAPDDFRLMWLSAYDRATIVSQSYAAANPNINAEFVFEIKTAIESIGVLYQDNDFFIDDLSYKTVMDILNFHPGCRPSLDALRETEWIDFADEAAAYNLISDVIMGKRFGLSGGVMSGLDRHKTNVCERKPALVPESSSHPMSDSLPVCRGEGKRVRRDTPIPVIDSANRIISTGVDIGEVALVSHSLSSALLSNSLPNATTETKATITENHRGKHNRPPPQLKPQPGKKQVPQLSIPISIPIIMQRPVVTGAEDSKNNIRFMQSPASSAHSSPQSSPRQPENGLEKEKRIGADEAPPNITKKLRQGYPDLLDGMKENC